MDSAEYVAFTDAAAQAECALLAEMDDVLSFLIWGADAREPLDAMERATLDRLASVRAPIRLRLDDEYPGARLHNGHGRPLIPCACRRNALAKDCM